MRVRRLRSPDPASTRGFEIVEGRTRIGWVTMKRERDLHLPGGEDRPPSIASITVADAHRRRRVGTALYQVAAREACRWAKLPLHSDIERTAAADAFWQKQVRMGRATCVRAWDDLMLPYDERASSTESIQGRGGCWRYKLTCPAPASLARARRSASARAAGRDTVAACTTPSKRSG